MKNRMENLIDELEKIETANTTLSQIMDRFLTERTYQECPDWIESNYYLGGLIQASEMLNRRIGQIAEDMKMEALK